MIRIATLVLIAALGAMPATFAQEAPAQAKPEGRPAPPEGGPPASNVRVDLTLTEEGDAAAPSKTVSVLVVQNELGRVRSGGPGPLSLNVDARPVVLPDGRVRLMLSLEYLPSPEAGSLSQSLTVVLANGKPQVVSHASDPRGTRRVRVEVTATIAK